MGLFLFRYFRHQVQATPATECLSLVNWSALSSLMNILFLAQSGALLQSQEDPREPASLSLSLLSQPFLTALSQVLIIDCLNNHKLHPVCVGKRLIDGCTSCLSFGCMYIMSQNAIQNILSREIQM